MVYFPEGTRSRDGEGLAFNDGRFQRGIREQVPVLPLLVEGSRAALPRNTWLFGGTQVFHLRVLEPVSAEGFNVKQSAELRDAISEKMSAEVHPPAPVTFWRSGNEHQGPLLDRRLAPSC